MSPTPAWTAASCHSPHKSTAAALRKQSSGFWDSLCGHTTRYHNALCYKADANYKCLTFTQGFAGLSILSETVPLHQNKLFYEKNGEKKPSIIKQIHQRTSAHIERPWALYSCMPWKLNNKMNPNLSARHLGATQCSEDGWCLNDALNSPVTGQSPQRFSTMNSDFSLILFHVMIWVFFVFKSDKCHPPPFKSSAKICLPLVKKKKIKKEKSLPLEFESLWDLVF